MITNKSHRFERGVRRRAIERIIAQYPKISDKQLYRLIRYFRRTASRHDIARIAANPVVRRQFHRLCRDHRVDRLRSIDRSLTGIAALLAALGITLAANS